MVFITVGINIFLNGYFESSKDIFIFGKVIELKGIVMHKYNPASFGILGYVKNTPDIQTEKGTF